ncbi:MAG: ATP-binding protein [Deltaproteobacteria bacterium]|nr:ATP-binding protein [Deltaproteobacteria bacterium]
MLQTIAPKSKFKAGMYLLETLSSGMYNDPLTIYREYIQNAVDSIDLVNRRKILSVKINLDPSNKKITFWDNGAGIPSCDALEVLSAIGSSNKVNRGMRGFRGIGRLGGLAFCEKATFKTKAYDETIESVQEWNCKELKRILSDNNESSETLKKLFDRTTNFYQVNSKNPKNSYFKVELEGVHSFRNYVFDLKRVHDYLASIAPVPFSSETFSFGKTISQFLNKKLDRYSTYNIYLNGHKIYKPYKDEIKITKTGYDYISEIKLFEINKENESLAYGWYGSREDLIGAIAKGEKSSGIRVRLGNILMGDEHLLDECFRELRFNSYFIGEIHINSPMLIPNSRRDDFIDNDYKTYFYNAISRKIGLPLSKEVRKRSRLYALIKKDASYSNKRTQNSVEKNDKISIIELRKSLNEHCNNCPKLNKIFESLNK